MSDVPAGGRKHAGEKLRQFDLDGQIAYDFDEFCKDYGHPGDKLFTLEVTSDAVTYVFADIAGTVRAGKVIFELNSDALVCTRKAH